MKDIKTTEEQLIIKNASLEQQVAELESSNSSLRRMIEYYSRLADSTPSMIFRQSIPDGRYEYMSRGALQVTGYSPEEIMDNPSYIRQIIHPDFISYIDKKWEQLLAGRVDPFYEFMIIDRSGNYRWLHQVNVLIRDAAGKPSFLESIVTDITQRKQAEQALLESEKQYRLITEKMSDIVWIADMNLRTIYVTPSVQAVLGFSQEERKRQTVNEQLTPASLAYGLEAMAGELALEEQHLGDPQRSATLILEYYHKDGSTRWLETIMSGIRDDQGVLIGIHGVSRDVTDRRQAQEALEKSEEYFRAITENATDVLFIIDAQGMITYCSLSVERIIGYKQPELIGMNVLDLIIPEDHARANKDFGKALWTKEIRIPNSFRVRHKNGAVIIMEGVGKNLLHDPVVAGFIMNVRDVTDRIRAEEAVKKNEEMLRLITENMSDMIRVADLQGNNLYVSPSHFKGLGYRTEERVGKSVFDIVHPDDIESIFGKFIEGRTANQLVRVEYRVRHADGHYIWLDTVVDLLRNAQGEPTAVVMSSRDISDRKQAEQEKRHLQERLHRAEKMEALGTLAGGVAHDLNNVLGVILGYAELLLNEVDKSSPLQSDLAIIMKSSEKAAAIVQDLLTLTRRGVPSRKVLNLNRIILDYQNSPELEVLSSYHPAVHITFDLEPDLLNVSGSPVHLEKVLFNLVANAVEAMPQGGNLNIKTANQYLEKPIYGYDTVRAGDYVVLTVTDTGEGIPSADLQRIFEPFYTKKVMGRSGTGLGLAVVWGTLKDHHGYINVQSEEGKGSIFTLYFPVTREGVSVESASVSLSEYQGRGETIVIVDDVQEQRSLAAAMLKQLHYKVSSVASGEEAIAYVKKHKVDLLLLDMIMDPGIDGLDTYKSIVKIRPGQKAIIVSGFSETERVDEAQKLGAGAYLRKPYVIEKLGLAVRRELDRKGK
jgi:two-component system cell cycle sensor histidine kinase/response regulator CckA